MNGDGGTKSVRVRVLATIGVLFAIALAGIAVLTVASRDKVAVWTFDEAQARRAYNDWVKTHESLCDAAGSSPVYTDLDCDKPIKAYEQSAFASNEARERGNHLSFKRQVNWNEALARVAIAVAFAAIAVAATLIWTRSSKMPATATPPRAPAPDAQPVPTSSQGESVTAALRELGRLRDEGLLSDEEFAAERRRLLDRL